MCRTDRLLVLGSISIVALGCSPSLIIESVSDSASADATETSASSGDGDGDGDGDADSEGDGDGEATTQGDGDGEATTQGDGDGDMGGDGDGEPMPDPGPDVCSSVDFFNSGDVALAGPADLLNFSPEDGFSVALWAYLNDYGPADPGYLLSKGNADSMEWSLTHQGGQLCFNHEGVGSIVCVPVATLSWHHYAVNYMDGSARIYQDGQLLDSGPGTVGEPAATQLHIGARDVDGGALDGRIDDVAVWNQTLGDMQIDGLAKGAQLPGDIGGLVGWWRFSEGEGNVIADASGQGLAAALSAGTWTTTCAEPGACWALELDQNGDGIRVAPSEDLDFGPNDSFTVGAWAYLYGSNSHIMVKGSNSSNEWSMTWDGNNGLCFNRQGEANLACAAAPTGRWHHYAARYAASQVTLFVDGEVIGMGAGMVGDAVPTELYLGAINNNNVLEGVLDEAAMWGAALSEAEIAAIAGGTTAPDELGSLVGWWRLTEGSGNSVDDSSGNTNDATLLDGDWLAICAP